MSEKIKLPFPYKELNMKPISWSQGNLKGELLVYGEEGKEWMQLQYQDPITGKPYTHSMTQADVDLIQKNANGDLTFKEIPPSMQ